jgi:hypothetical protein
MVERLFRDLSQQRLRRAVFHSVRELIAAIQLYIGDHNRHPNRSFGPPRLPTFWKK